MKIIVTGGSGLLGSTILERHSSECDIMGTAYSSDSLVKLDVRDRTQVADLFERYRPDGVVHAAAMRNDLVERDHEAGYKVNVEGTRNVAVACKNAGAFMVHVSTDLVFDGKKGSYKEEDLPSPVSYYGQTKAIAEQTAKEVLPDVCIARTSLLYGWKEPNLAMLVINSLKECRPFKAVSDQYVTPSYTGNVADMLIELCRKRISGIYHVAGSSRLTRFEFSRQIADVFSFDPELIRPISMNSLEWGTKRGADCSLDVNLITKTLETKPLSSKEGLRAMKNDEQR